MDIFRQFRQDMNVRSGIVFFVLSLALLLPRAVRADFSLPGMVSANSISGQFVVTSSPKLSDLALLSVVATNREFIRLEPALLTVSAERIKQALMAKLGVDPHTPWSGNIYLAVHPAQSLDESVAVVSSRFNGRWVYHLLLPDVLPRQKLVRALTGAVLLEYANRNAGDRSAEVPAWLIEGFSQELLAAHLQDFALTEPDQAVNDIPVDRVNFTQRGVDPLAGARGVLQTYSVLTFQQLSWPTDLQLSGEDGGVYRASAQLFADELLGMPGGAAKMRGMLQALPRYYNWQTAFQQAFRHDFPTPLDVEKWWALQTVLFTAHSPGVQWTPEASREKLDEILSVPIQFRTATNSLPNTAAVSLQQVIRNFDGLRQMEILGIKLRDLELAQLRMAPALAVLTVEYRDTLAAYLGQPIPNHERQIYRKYATRRATARETVVKLDELDAQRRSLVLAGQFRFQ
jgi:hypothetical protein